MFDAREARASVRRGAREAWHWLRNAPDRALHDSRRSAALAVLGRYGEPEAVLFVCQGNIYRSPFAAAVLRAVLPMEARSALRICSAGFVGPGRPAPEDARAAAAEYSIDLGAHRSQLLTAPLLNGHTLCVVMDPAQLARVRASEGYAGQLVLNLGDLDPAPILTRSIQDPWSGAPGVLRSSYMRIERCTRMLGAALVRVPG